MAARLPPLGAIEAFAAAARTQSFTEAARELNLTTSAVSRRIAALEAQLGVRLFHRTTRQVSLTPDGERLFERCQRVLTELEGLQAEASGVHAEPSGVLRIDMPIAYGRQVVLPLLAGLATRHPALELDMRLSDAYVDLVKDGIDIAIRVGALSDSGLVARRIASQDLLLCAAPAYLAAHGTPRRLEALAAHAPILFRMPSSGRDRPWQFGVDGQTVTLHPAARLRANDGEAMAHAARLGLGIAQLPHYMVEADIAAGRLVELLARHRPPTMPPDRSTASTNCAAASPPSGNTAGRT